MIEEPSKSHRQNCEQSDTSRANPTKVMRTLRQIQQGRKNIENTITRVLDDDADVYVGQPELLSGNVTDEFGPPYTREIEPDGKIGKRISLNERHFAALMVKGGGVIHEPGEGFFQYDSLSGLWKELSPDMASQHAAALLREVANIDGCKELEKKITDKLQKAIVSQARGIGERRDFFEKAQEIIHVQNGVFRRKGGELVFYPDGFQPGHRSLSRIEIPYDPEAKCPETETSLVRFNLSEEDAEVYWKYVGLCLLKRNITRRILIIHSEKSGTSKSPLTDIAGSLVKNSIELRTDHLDGRFETHRLIGRSMLIGPDVAGDFLNKKGAHVLLRLTGGDLITPEGKFDKSKMTKSIKGRFCVMISSNHHLRVNEGAVVDPWRKRLIILESLGNKVKKEIDGYAEILLQKEGAGILNRAIEGLKSLLKDIEDGDAFRLSDTQKGRVESLLSSSNTGQQFIRQCLESGGNVTTAELEEAYFNLCRDNGWQPRSDFKKVIKETISQTFALNEQNSITRGGKDQKGYRGIQLKEECRRELGQKGQLFEKL